MISDVQWACMFYPCSHMHHTRVWGICSLHGAVGVCESAPLVLLYLQQEDHLLESCLRLIPWRTGHFWQGGGISLVLEVQEDDDDDEEEQWERLEMNLSHDLGGYGTGSCIHITALHAHYQCVHLHTHQSSCTSMPDQWDSKRCGSGLSCTTFPMHKTTNPSTLWHGLSTWYFGCWECVTWWLSGADDRVAKSDGRDVGGTWLQLMCCALPKCLCP